MFCKAKLLQQIGTCRSRQFHRPSRTKNIVLSQYRFGAGSEETNSSFEERTR